jgi:hypothetical protein
MALATTEFQALADRQARTWELVIGRMSAEELVAFTDSFFRTRIECPLCGAEGDYEAWKVHPRTHCRLCGGRLVCYRQPKEIGDPDYPTVPGVD